MKRLSLLSFLLALLLPAASKAQVMGNYKYDEQVRWNVRQQVPSMMASQPHPNEITLDIRALMNVRADKYVAIFNIRQAGESAISVNELMAARIGRFVRDLDSLGINESDVYVDMISQVPVYAMEVEKKVFSKTYNEVPVGFELQKNIHITYARSELLDEMVAMAARQEIYDFVKTSYYSGEHQAHFDSLRSASITLAARMLADYGLLGFDLDSSNLTLSDQSFISYPISHYSTYQAYSSVSFEEATRGRGLFSSFGKAAKSTTMYYNAPSYEQYDIVINPVVTEPVIQFTYNLVVKYRVEPEKEVIRQTDKEYYILLPDGNLRKVELH